MLGFSRRLLQLTVALPARKYRAAILLHYAHKPAANSSRPAIKPRAGNSGSALLNDADGLSRESESAWDSPTSANQMDSVNNSGSAYVPTADQFGLLATKETENHPVVHKSLEGRLPRADLLKPSDSTLLDPLEEPETIRRTIRLRTQRPDERLTWNARQIALQCARGDVDAALKAFFDGALGTERVIPPRYLVHRLLGALAEAGRSADAFHVYKKMKEIGMPPTQATYSRLFRACAEDCAVWYRENEHLFPRASNNQFLSSFQRHRNRLLEKALCTDELVGKFGGPGLHRAQGLWKKLHSDNVPLTPITVNALLLALAKGGDLTGCFQVLDTVLSTSPSHHRSSSKQQPQSTFQPDSYTVTALLSAVRPATMKRYLLATTTSGSNSPPSSSAIGKAESSPMTGFDLSLTIWHRMLPYMTSAQWGPQCFVSLVHSIRLGFEASDTASHHMLLFHPQLGLQTIKPNANGADHPQKRLSASQVNEIDMAAEPTPPLSQITDLVSSESIASASTDIQSVLGLDRPVRVFRPDWDDVGLSLRSPINLLLPMDHAVLIVPPNQGWLPWHRLALIGGLNGLLDCVKQQYNSNVTVQLLTALVELIPTPVLAQSTEALDEWEREVIRAASQHNVRLDMGIFNALIDRRTRAGHSGSPLLSEAVRLGLIPDQITWGSLAKGCKTITSVKSLLHGFAQASGSKDLKFIRPSQAFFASLLRASGFNWDVKAYVLRVMCGEEDTDDTKSEHGNRSGNVAVTGTQQNQRFLGIEPNRRLIADLEIDIALFRQLLCKGVIPKDGSAVAASPETEGVSIPRYAENGFQRFLPVYRKWLSIRCEDNRL